MALSLIASKKIDWKQCCCYFQHYEYFADGNFSKNFQRIGRFSLSTNAFLHFGYRITFNFFSLSVRTDLLVRWYFVRAFLWLVNLSACLIRTFIPLADENFVYSIRVFSSIGSYTGCPLKESPSLIVFLADKWSVISKCDYLSRNWKNPPPYFLCQVSVPFY